MRTWARWLGVLTFVLLLTVPIAHAEEERELVFRGLAWGDPPEALGQYLPPEETVGRQTSSQALLDWMKGGAMASANVFMWDVLGGRQDKSPYIDVLKPTVFARMSEME